MTTLCPCQTPNTKRLDYIHDKPKDKYAFQLQVPPNLFAAHQLVMAVVNEQKAYLERWRSSGAAFDVNDPLVNSSHQKLLQAYNELMRMYPQENAHNKQAFFDHLCTLDFK